MPRSRTSRFFEVISTIYPTECLKTGDTKYGDLLHAMWDSGWMILSFPFTNCFVNHHNARIWSFWDHIWILKSGGKFCFSTNSFYFRVSGSWRPLLNRTQPANHENLNWASEVAKTASDGSQNVQINAIWASFSHRRALTSPYRRPGSA